MIYDNFRPIPGLDIPRPPALGKVIYVDKDATSVSDSNEGTDANYPLNTVNTALGKCTTNKNDYIFVINGSSEDTEPITPAIATVHIIGMGMGPAPLQVCLTAGGDSGVFTLGSAAPKTEIAGFCLGGGANHGGIVTSGSPYGLWIHHNQFGHEFNGAATPKYGIETNTAPTGASYCAIEDNIFFGTDGTASPGKIDSNGILAYGCKGLVLRRNVFLGIPGINVQITDAVKCIIMDNQFALDGNTTGRAITLAGTCYSCWINGNHANFGKTAIANVPWADSQTDNHWGANYNGDGISYPA